MDNHFQDLRTMQRFTPGCLNDLLALTEAVCDDQRIGYCLLHRRQQRGLAADDENILFVPFKTKRSGYAAAASIEHVEVEDKFFSRSFSAFIFNTAVWC